MARQHNEHHFQRIGRGIMTGNLKGANVAAWIFWMKAQFNWDEAGTNEFQEDVGLEFES